MLYPTRFDVIVVGGGVMAAGELLLGPARRIVAQRALAPSRDQVRIVATHFGDASVLQTLLRRLQSLHRDVEKEMHA